MEASKSDPVGKNTPTRTHTQTQANKYIQQATYAYITAKQTQKQNKPKPEQKQDTNITLDNITTNDTWQNIYKHIETTYKNLKPFTASRAAYNAININIPAANTKAKQTFLDTANLDTNIFGSRVHAYEAATETRPWLCISGIHTETNIADIEQALAAANIEHIGLKRHQSGKSPSALIMFKTNQESLETALKTELIINQKQKTIQYFIDSHISRCTHCQGLDHTKAQCKSNHHTCVRCAGSCKIGECKNTKRKCANCKQNHAASYSQCPKIKALQKAKYHESLRKINNHANQLHQEQIQENQTKTESNIQKLKSKIEQTQQNLEIEVSTSLSNHHMHQWQDTELERKIEEQNQKIEEQNQKIKELNQTIEENKQKVEEAYEKMFRPICEALKQQDQEINQLKSQLKTQMQTTDKIQENIRETLKVGNHKESKETQKIISQIIDSVVNIAEKQTQLKQIHRNVLINEIVKIRNEYQEITSN